MKKIAIALVLASLGGIAPAVVGLRAAAPDVTVTESIMALGGGMYQYTYTLTNVSAVAPIWWWGVYTNAAWSGTATSSSLPMTGGYGSVTGTDMDLAGYGAAVWAFNGAYGGTDPTSVGTGFTDTLTFTATGLDSSTKDFFADIEGEWAGAGSLPFLPDGTQTLSYMGHTGPVPEPASVLTLAVAGAALLRRRPR